MTDKPSVPEAHIDLLALIRAGTHFVEKKGTKLHVIECLTGNIVCILSENTQGFQKEQLVPVTLHDGTKVWTQPALAPSVLMTHVVVLNPLVIDLMCQQIVLGKSITEICTMDGFPSYTTYCRWRREHAWIDKAVEKAKQDRADYYRDKVMDEAERAHSTKDPINATNAKIDAYKWAASVDNPGVYSPKAKIEATMNVPTQINIITGIDREKEPRAVEQDDKNS